MMRSAYSVEPITCHRVDKAFALAKLARPSLTVEVWRRFCRSAIVAASQNDGRSASVLVAVNSSEYVQALCVHRTEDVEGTQVLSVRCFIVASTLDPSGVQRELVRALIDTCRKQNRREMRIERGCLDAGAVAQLEASGFRPAGEWMCFTL